MDALYYVIFTYTIIVISFLLFISVVVYKFISKSNLKIWECLILGVLVIGMYLVIPLSLFRQAVANGSPENYDKALSLYSKALKLSINPFEKRLCYGEMGAIYYFQRKNGNLAIEYLEKACKGDYTVKTAFYSGLLANLYIVKGDYNKAEKIFGIKNVTKGEPYALLETLRGDYDKAVSRLDLARENAYTYMMASALYNELGNNEMSEDYYKKAISKFESIKFQTEQQKVEARQRLEVKTSVKSMVEYENLLKQEYGL